MGSISTRRDCPWATTICPKASLLRDSLPHAQLDDYANEVLLLHGTSKADDIALQGFDDRMNRRNLYGIGVYLTIDACKAAQYCEGGELVIARAILGHPYLATGPMETHL